MQMMTRFRPQEHGFHFSNNDVQYEYNLFHGTQLCGGMSFASLDYFNYQMPIPADTSAPAVGTPLNNYLLRRQMDAHRVAVPQLVAGGSYEACVRGDQVFGRLKSALDMYSPVPLLLSSANSSLSTNSHWVVAIGYEALPTSIWGCASMTEITVYDNAQPDAAVSLTPDVVQNNFKLKGTRRRYGFYYPYTDYRAIRPTQELMRRNPSPDFSQMPESF